MTDINNINTEGNDMQLRVWWIPQVPGKAFNVDVDSIREGAKLMSTLAAYDLFQYDNNIKPDYSNAGGLIMFDPEDKVDGPDGSWVDWYDEETNIDDPAEFLEWMREDGCDAA